MNRETQVNHLANISAMLMLLRDRIGILKEYRLFNGITERAHEMDRYENTLKTALIAIESGANKSLDYFEKNSKRLGGSAETAVAFQEIEHLSHIMEKFLEALADIDPKHHEAICVDFANVIKHYKVRPNKLIVAERIREAHELAVKTHPTASHHSFMLGYLACIEDMTNPNK